MSKFFQHYGMVLVLIALCVFFALITLKEQPQEGPTAASNVFELVQGQTETSDLVLVVSSNEEASKKTAGLVAAKLSEASYSNVREVSGTPQDVRSLLDELKSEGQAPAVICVSGKEANWRLWEILPTAFPEFSAAPIISPPRSVQSTFTKMSNLKAIVNRIVVIAVVAIGMTMVIITAGIDLSVGSLIALSAVIGTYTMKELGGLDGSTMTVAIGFFVAVLACGLFGAFSGVLVAWFRIAPFIATLAVMMIARGNARQVTGGFSIYQVPESLSWLGQKASFGIPNTMILLVATYLAAHIFMSKTKFGRYIYAVGGNEEAARLSGVPVRRVLIFVYVLSGITAGIGGCIQASQLNAGSPNSALMYELYVIAAVVVGGTSLAGGSGRILGTLIGAFIIAVIQNGMNLIGLESYTQMVVLGFIILGAVLLDTMRGRSPLKKFVRFAQKAVLRGSGG